MALAVLSIFAGAFLAPWVCRVFRGHAGWVLAALPAGVFIYLLTFLPGLGEKQPLVVHYPWVPSLGVAFSFLIDGLSLSYALLITGIGALITAYTGAYMKADKQIHRFYLYLLMFMGSMAGLVLADNLITMFVFWELTSITSYLLIGYEHQKASARAAAWQALIVTGAGGLALMAGIILLGAVTGTYELSSILEMDGAVKEHGLYTAIVVLVLAGAFTKSAQFPFHYWLPNAMAAPTPASAYLHSSTMVKAGLYLVARLSPALGGTDLWTSLVIAAGVLTMLAAGYYALRQTVLKPLLAYTTVAALGIIMTCTGIGTELAMKAAMVFLFVHAFYKAALFMVAGALDHETGEKDVEKLSGLRGAMPYTAAAAGLSALSMAGLPPFLGFIGKETVYEAALHAPVWTFIITVSAVFANMANVFVALMVGVKPFWGAQLPTPKQAHEGPLALWLGPAVLGSLGLLMGLVPGWFGYSLAGPGASAMFGPEVTAKLSHWHGLNLALGLSVITLAGGYGFYRVREVYRRQTDRLTPFEAYGPEAGYDACMAAMVGLATRQTNFFQNGYLRYYLLSIVAMVLIVPGYTLFGRSQIDLAAVIVPGEGPLIHEAIVGLVIVGAAIAATVVRSRLAAIVSLGVVGYGVALIFIFFGAPDLAMTQLVIETLTVILFVLVVYKLPPYIQLSSPGARVRDMLIAAVFGLFMMCLVMVAVQYNYASPISEYHAMRSAPDAHGRNVVNVILVDFRALDTLGEITVLGVAALGAFGLLKLRMGTAGERKAP